MMAESNKLELSLLLDEYGDARLECFVADATQKRDKMKDALAKIERVREAIFLLVEDSDA